MTETLPILYRDEHVVAVHKPAGLLVHRTGIDRHETRFAVQILRDQIGQHVFPVHRLDKGTSGVLLFALNTMMARELMQRFVEQGIHKYYWAVVRGHPLAQGRIDHPLDRIQDAYAKGRATGATQEPWVELPTESSAESFAESFADSAIEPAAQQPNNSQSAVTDYRRLATIELPVAVDRYPMSRYALLELTPYTGRRHQIRRHLKHLAHPIIGDVRYGKGSHNRYFREALAAPRMLLACVRMRFSHPLSGEEITIDQPVDGCFLNLLTQWQWPTLLR